MADSGLKICAGLTLVLASIPILGALYARTYQYYWSSYGLFALSAFVFAMSVCSYIGYRTIKQGTPFLLRFLGRLNNVLTPVAHYLSHNKVIGPLFSVVIRANFFVSFMVLLLGDQLLRAVVGRFVGRHAKRWNLSVANAVDPYFHFFDDTIPEFTEAHQDTSQSQNKQHIINRLGRPIDTIPKYSPRLAYTLSIASKLVYEDVGVLEHELEKDGFDMTTFRPMAYRNICAFIAKKDNDILLVFRGTNPLNIQNFVTNITVGMKEINSMGKVHKGFWEAMGEPTPHTLPHNSTFKIELNGASLYRTVMSAVNAVLEIVRFATRHMLHHFSDPVDSSWIGFDTDIRSRSMFSQAEGHILDICQNSKDQPIRLYITGHSLGGAMATIFLAKMMQSKSPLMDHFAGLYTYGQPNVGDENFTRAFGPQISDKIFRHAYNNDIVSRIPHFSFYNTPPGTLVFIDAAYNVSLYPPTLSTNKPVRVRGISFLHLSGLLNRSVIRRLPQENWLRIGLRFLFPFFINDHFPSEYSDSLRNATFHWITENESLLQEGGSETTYTNHMATSEKNMIASA